MTGEPGEPGQPGASGESFEHSPTPVTGPPGPPLSAPPEVVAAIAAAVEAVWPRPVVRRSGAGSGERGSPEYVWRFSGRWWSKPVPLRRDRPWASTSGEHGQVGTEGY